MNQIDVFNYSSFRSYLHDYILERKKTTKSFSLSQMAKKMGLANTASLSRIVKGDREPGQDISDKLIRYFEFSDEQSSYFRYLILLEKAKKDPQLKVMLMEKLRDLHPQKKFHLLDEKTFRVIANWYYISLREVVRLRNFYDDPQHVVDHLYFKITPSDVKEAYHTLTILGLIEKSPSGKLVQTQNAVDTENDVASEAIKRYHEQSIDNSKIALREMDISTREFQAASFAVKLKDLPLLKEEIRDFKYKIMQKYEASHGEGDEVYQMNIQLFPVTKFSELDKNALFSKNSESFIEDTANNATEDVLCEEITHE